MSLVSFGLIGLLAGLIFGLNPTLISTISVYMAAMVGRGIKKQRYALVGLIFLTMFGLFILFFASLVTTILTSLTPLYSDSVNLLISIIGVVVGSNLIRRYFWPESKMQPPKNIKKILHQRTTKKTGLFNILALAIIVSYASISSVGMAVLLLGSYSVVLGPTSLVWGLPFIIGLIMPMYFVIVMMAYGTKASAIISWKEKNKSSMRLYNGLTLIALSWLLLFIIANDKVIYL